MRRDGLECVGGAAGCLGRAKVACRGGSAAVSMAAGAGGSWESGVRRMRACLSRGIGV